MDLEYNNFHIRIPPGFKAALKPIEVDSEGYSKFSIEFNEVMINTPIEEPLSDHDHD